MASVSFHHRARIFESGETPLLVRQARTAVVGLIGTAPDADAVKFPLNKPIQLLRPADAEGLGVAGTLMNALDTIWDQVGAPVIIVRVEEGEDMAETWGNAVGSQVSFTGVHAFRRAKSDGLYRPKLFIAPGLTATSPADGIQSIAVTAGGADYVQETTTVSITGTGGAGAQARAVVTDGAVTSIIVEKPGYGFTGTVTVAINGAGTGATATAAKGSVVNPVVAEMQGVADALRGMFYPDGPDSTDQAAVQYRALINHQRTAVVDPKILKFDTEDNVNVPQPSSPLWAAAQAKMDLERGFWWAGSNVGFNGVTGTNRPIEYGPQSNYLNEHRVNTIVNINNQGLRLWGVWTCASDLMWQFIPVRRTADAINEALEDAYLQVIGRPFSVANIKFIVEAGRNYLRLMEAEGALLPGSDCWPLDTNTNEEMAQGIFKIGLKYEPPAPIVDLRGTAYRNIVAYDLLLDKVAQQLPLAA